VSLCRGALPSLHRALTSSHRRLSLSSAGKKALQGATEAQREAASRGVHYRATVAREIADVLSEAAETVAPPSVVKLVRAYLPGSELPARFVIDS
jgi:hypothetical protein